MDFSFTRDQRQLIERVNQLVKERIAPRARAVPGMLNRRAEARTTSSETDSVRRVKKRMGTFGSKTPA